MPHPVTVLRPSLPALFLLSLSACQPMGGSGEGYYSREQTWVHQVFPPQPDNPIRAEEREGPYPLRSNPEGFVDGFNANRYGVWQQIELAPDTGAICGNGTPYRFFLNRVANNRNFILYFEGGGACWDYESCTGATGIRGARNPKGIPNGYLKDLQTALASPFVFRQHGEKHQANDWNYVYVPYCTGDVYAGDRVADYPDPKGEKPPLHWHHNGLKNVRAVVAWIRDNLQQPARLLTTGCSAGGVGALVNYHFIRRDLAPSKSYLLNDSGPVYLAPEDGQTWYSRPMHEKIRSAWGLDPIIESVQQDVPGFDKENLGTLMGELARSYPHDRLAHTHFVRDLNFSGYSYERFYPEITTAPDLESRRNLIHDYWLDDTQKLMQELDHYPNWAYFIPHFRDLNESHCTTIVEFNNSNIEADAMGLLDFVNLLLDDTQPLHSYYEADGSRDFARPTSLVYRLLNEELGAPASTKPGTGYVLAQTESPD